MNNEYLNFKEEIICINYKKNSTLEKRNYLASLFSLSENWTPPSKNGIIPLKTGTSGHPELMGHEKELPKARTLNYKNFHILVNRV
jgi:hypothetical protein